VHVRGAAMKGMQDLQFVLCILNSISYWLLIPL